MCLTRMYCTMSIVKLDGSIGPCGGPVNVHPSAEHGTIVQCQFCSSVLRLTYVSPSYYIKSVPVGGLKILKPTGQSITMEG